MGDTLFLKSLLVKNSKITPFTVLNQFFTRGVFPFTNLLSKYLPLQNENKKIIL